MRHEIVPCGPLYLRRLIANLEPADLAEIEDCGIEPRELIPSLWRRTANPRCALVDGDVAAVWGDHAGLLEAEGQMWLFTTPLLRKVPFLFFREARRELVELLGLRESLSADVGALHKRAIRTYRILGFEVGCMVAVGGSLMRPLRIRR